MRAAFVDFSCNFFEKYHVYSLASYIRGKGVEVDYINAQSFEDALRQVRRLGPDLLLYSAFASDADVFLRFDRIVKDRLGTRSIMGGPGPTFDFSYAKRSTIDAFCVGEGELALEEYIAGGFAGGKNIILKGGDAPQALHKFIDLDSIPIPDRAIVYDHDPVAREMPTKGFLISRGCPYQCTYCHNHTFNKMFRESGKVIRRKSVAYVIEEVQRTRRSYPLTNVLFHDDNFLLDKAWFQEFCAVFPREIGLKYGILARANNISEEVAEALRASGCIFVSWSIECANDEIRNAVIRRNMSREQMLNAARLLNKHRIHHKIGNMLGLPGESFDDMLATLDMNIDCTPAVSLATIFTPYPGLQITDYAVSRGYVSAAALEHLPSDYFTETILNYTPAEKRRISRLAWLFPILVSYPALRRSGPLFRFLMDFPLPRVLLRGVFEIFYLWKYSSIFKVKVPFGISLQVLRRHLKEKLGWHKL